MKHLAAAGFVVLPVLTMLGNGCTVHDVLQGVDLDGGELGSDASPHDSGRRIDSGTSRDAAVTSDDGSTGRDGSTSSDGSTLGDGAATGCAPGNVSSLTPTFKPPTALHQGLCTPTQVSAFVDCLNGVPDAPTCKTFMTANASCVACALTRDTAAAYGPLVEGTVTIDINVPGCIARETGDLSATGCGAKGSAVSQCEHLACEANCPVPATDTGAAFNALIQCQQASDGTVCKPYADAARCEDALLDGGVAGPCALAAPDFSGNAKTMVALFCGT